VGGIAAPTDPEQVAITDLVGKGSQGDWATVLTKLKVKYVLLAREVDFASFWYLDYLPDFVKVGDYGSIVLYRVSGPGQSKAPQGP
jgi:hypothetical protein